MSQARESHSKGRLSRRRFLSAAAGTPVATRLFFRPASAAGETVRVGFPLSDHYAPVYIAKEKGFFADAGLQIDFKNFVTGGPRGGGLGIPINGYWIHWNAGGYRSGAQIPGSDHGRAIAGAAARDGPGGAGSGEEALRSRSSG